MLSASLIYACLLTLTSLVHPSLYAYIPVDWSRLEFHCFRHYYLATLVTVYAMLLLICIYYAIYMADSVFVWHACFLFVILASRIHAHSSVQGLVVLVYLQ